MGILRTSSPWPPLSTKPTHKSDSLNHVRNSPQTKVLEICKKNISKYHKKANFAAVNESHLHFFQLFDFSALFKGEVCSVHLLWIFNWPG